MNRSLISRAAAVALSAPAAADAATVHYEGPPGAEVLVVTGAPGERNLLGLQDHEVPEAVTLYDAGVTWDVRTEYCRHDPQYPYVECPAPNGVRIQAGDGDDWVTRGEGVIEPVTMLGGPGNDRLEGNGGPDVIEGGDGSDRVHGYGGDDSLDGGAGGDVVDGYSGRDAVRGGDGDDTLHGDGYEAASADVIDGGAGVDTIESDYSTRLIGDEEPLLRFTLGGGADDGRPGEGDDVQRVERLVMSKGGTYVGSEGPDYVKLHQVGDAGVLDGRGGDDELRGGDGQDRIDGGAGSDRLDGGFNDDIITGGPGRDVISADLAGGDCGPWWCKYPYGNDTVQARDGEADSVSCGAGTDKVVADAIDTVAPDCEQIERAAGTSTPGKTRKRGGATSPSGGGTVTAAEGPALTVRTPGRLRLTLRDGLTAKLTGFTQGRYTVAARFRGKVVASHAVRVGAKGTATAHLRFTRRARRSLSRRRSVTLVVKAGSVTRTVTVKR